MPPPIWPISAMTFPLESELVVQGTAHSFGGLHEQRIIFDLPVGLRADGEGGERLTLEGTLSMLVLVVSLTLVQLVRVFQGIPTLIMLFAYCGVFIKSAFIMRGRARLSGKHFIGTTRMRMTL